jgi:hypothetical protein
MPSKKAAKAPRGEPPAGIKRMRSAPAPGADRSEEKAAPLARSACRDSESTGLVWEVPYPSDGWCRMRSDH